MIVVNNIVIVALQPVIIYIMYRKIAKHIVHVNDASMIIVQFVQQLNLINRVFYVSEPVCLQYVVLFTRCFCFAVYTDLYLGNE